MTPAPTEILSLPVRGSATPVSAVLTRAAPAPGPRPASPPVVLLLGHGVTNDRESPLLVGLLEGLAPHGVTGLRFNYPFKERGDPSPDPRDILFATLDAALAWARAAFGPDACLVLGGKSLSARIAAAHQARFGRAQAMAYLGFPLHPPEDRTRLRGRDLQEITVPQYCAQGDRDPFCDLALFMPLCAAIGTPFHLEIIEGGDHGLGLDPGAEPARAAAILDRLVSTTRAWIDRHLR